MLNYTHKAHIQCTNSDAVSYASVIKATTSNRWRSADRQLDKFLADFAKEKGIFYSIQDCLSCIGMLYTDLYF